MSSKYKFIKKIRFVLLIVFLLLIVYLLSSRQVFADQIDDLSRWIQEKTGFVFANPDTSEFLFEKETPNYKAFAGEKKTGGGHKLRIEFDKYRLDMRFLKTQATLISQKQATTSASPLPLPSPVISSPSSEINLATDSASATLSANLTDSDSSTQQTIIDLINERILEIQKSLENVSEKIESVKNQVTGVGEETAEIVSKAQLIDEEKTRVVKFEEITKGVDMLYRLTERGIKEEIVLKEDPRQLATKSAEIAIKNEFVFSLDIEGLVYKKLNDGSWEFTNSEGKAIFKIPKGFARDANDSVNNDVSVNIVQNDGKLPSHHVFVYLQIPVEWLMSSERTYPVTVDPSLEVTHLSGETETNETENWQEIEEERGKHSQVYQSSLDSNKKHLSMTLATINYESVIDSGKFDTPVDTTPIRVNNNQLDGWMVTQNGWHYALGKPSDKTTDGWVGFGGRQGQHWFKYHLARVGYLHWPTRAWQDIGGSPTYNRTNLSYQTSNLTLGPNKDSINVESKATWNDIWTTPNSGSLSLSWRINADQLKEEITINQAAREWVAANRPPTTPPSETWFGFIFQIDWSDIPKVVRANIQQNINGDFSDDGENIELKDAANRLLAFMPIDFVIAGTPTKNQNPAEYQAPLRKRFWRDIDGNYYLLIGLKTDVLNELQAGNLVFDPTLNMNVSSNADDWGIWYNSAWVFYSDREAPNPLGYAYAGYYIYRYWGGTRFTLSSSIPSGATIDSAYLSLYGNETWQWDSQDYLRLFVTDSSNAPQVTTAGERPSIDGGSTTTYPTTAAGGIRWPSSGGLTWSYPAYNQSVNINSLIQYLVNQYGGLSSGNGIVVWFTEDAPTGSNNDSEAGWMTYEGGSSYAAKLDITYSTGASLDQLMRHGKWFSSGVKQAFTW